MMPDSTLPAYDAFSSDYDRFVNWNNRLPFELPFLEKQLASLGALAGLRVLDAACGTGMHALALARLGCQVTGADLSHGMVERARANATAAGLPLGFIQAGFGSLSAALSPSSFDALLCLGNSLPHILTPAELSTALLDFAACLRPGGLLLIQNRNFDAVMNRRERWMEPQNHLEDGVERIFLRLYDYLPDGLIDFHIITLRRELDGHWQQQVNTTRLFPLLHNPLIKSLQDAGFDRITAFGGLNGSPFDPTVSGNLVLSARKA
jgi:glycine/sarcosine N-methyltransferase